MPNSNSAVVRPSSTRRRGLIGWFKRVNGVANRSGVPLSLRGQRAVVVEPLEDRQLMSVVYLSSSTGSDRNTGTSPSSPVASTAKAFSLVHPGDTLLLKCGDSWGQSLGNWSKSNTTIGSYGTGAKPKISTGTADGLAIIKASNVTVRGISFVGLNGTARNGIVTTGGNGNLTIDNCDVTGFRMNITAQGYFGAVNGLKITNSNISRANGKGMSSGLYADNVHGLTLTNNVFDHNGGTGSIFNHGAYITAKCTNLTVTGSTFSYSSNFGLQARCGGVITGNTFANNSVGLSVGIVNGGGVHTDGGVTCTVTNNTFTGVGVGLKSGLGMDLGNIKSGVVSGNKFVNGTGYKYAAAISLDRGTAAGLQVGVLNLKIMNNTASHWGGTGVYVSPTAGARNLTVSGNSL